MRLFALHRVEDESGISGTGVVAQGVVFDDGTVALRWLTAVRSSGSYDSMADVEVIHGHGGKTKVIYIGAAYLRAMDDWTQDCCEGIPYGSVGARIVGDVPDPFVAPNYIVPHERDEYLAGYWAASSKARS